MALHLEMDLERQEIANLEELKANPTAWGLANAVAAESGQEEWNQLRRIYWELKQYWTEHSDLEQVEVSFPPEVLAGTMVAYFDIFPFARRLEFTHEQETWLSTTNTAAIRNGRARKPFSRLFALPRER